MQTARAFAHRVPSLGVNRAGAAALVVACVALAACAASPPGTPGLGGHPVTAAGSRRAPDAGSLWLDRVTFGIDSQSVAAYRRLGRVGFLDQQFGPDPHPLPPAIDAQIAALEIEHLDAAHELLAVREENKRISELPDPAAREAARKIHNERGNRLAYEAARRLLLQAVYSRDQLREQMVWFWLNHFSVFQGKAHLRWLVADYEARAIRPYALGHFRDLVMATLAHPAMLQYLDNAQNAADHVNENYARELMELHTLGVAGGYSQKDVQELARVLTGVGLAGATPPHLKREFEGFYRRDGAMEFNPARHDFGAKTLLGQPITAQGYAEIEQAVDRLVGTPACARFVSRKLAVYFVADQPPEALVKRLAATFHRTGGDITAVLRDLFRSPEFEASLGTKFRDPVHFVVGSIRLAYDGRPIQNTHPLVNWLNSLGEPLFGHQTPEGYPLTESGWASSGQMSRRFEIARAIGSGSAGLFEPEDGGGKTSTGFPRLSSPTYYEELEPRLSAKTLAALDQATSQQEWNTLLLASPELNYR
ncbi:MAG TPA: DUF1800 domain-containing protein [Steroidobacteraceae bacterium]|nr:DUF1800 domain-containing protein [Steroidobacteraceae bacterium]